MDENYISLERAIERMYEVTEECGTERIFIDRIIDELENLPSSPNICIHPQWSPVSERLPENDLPKDSKSKQIKVLVAYMRNGNWVIRTNLRKKGQWYGRPNEWDWSVSDPITHWMPLPQPPKEVDK